MLTFFQEIYSLEIYSIIIFYKINYTFFQISFLIKIIYDKKCISAQDYINISKIFLISCFKCAEEYPD